MDPTGWAAHPNHALRLAIAEYVARGWRVESLEAGRAIVIRRKRFQLGKWAFFGELYPLAHLLASDERRRLTVRGGYVDDMKLPGNPRNDPPP